MQRSTFWNRMRKAYQRYDGMMEKQGFYVVLGVCIVIIVLSAVVTFSQRRQSSAPVVVERVESAGGNQQAQTMEEVLIASRGAALTPVPSEPPLSFSQPVSGVTIRFYSVDEPQYFEKTNTWQVHTGIDLQTDIGTPVKASASGTVLTVVEEGGMGLCVVIDHKNGYETYYAGLSGAEYIKPGDPVYQGQVIGHTGNGVLAEAGDLPHLHFEVRRNSVAIDPLLVFLGLEETP